MRFQLKLSSNDSSQSVISTNTVSKTVIPSTTTTTIVNTLSTTILPCTCTYCEEAAAEMSGAFAVYKVRDHISGSKDSSSSSNGNGSSWSGTDQKSQSSYFQSTCMKATSDRESNPPAKYNEKMMMSIWGLYNKYSVHNIKSHNTFENHH